MEIVPRTSHPWRVDLRSGHAGWRTRGDVARVVDVRESNCVRRHGVGIAVALPRRELHGESRERHVAVGTDATHQRAGNPDGRDFLTARAASVQFYGDLAAVRRDLLGEGNSHCRCGGTIAAAYLPPGN